MYFLASQNRMFFLFVCIVVLSVPWSAYGLEAGEVVVVANAQEPASLKLAAYYMKQRHIPAEHLITLHTTQHERCTREEYEQEIRKPVRAALIQMKDRQQIRCLVTLYGIPLAIKASPAHGDGHLTELVKQHTSLVASKKTAQGFQLEEIQKELANLKKLLVQSKRMTTMASVDSELALVLMEDYPLTSWLPNPYFLGLRGQKTLAHRDEVLMVSRLDGPTPDIAKRLVDDALAVEKKGGLTGRAYFDARWPRYNSKKRSGYTLYDASLHDAANGLQQKKIMPTTVNDGEDLFTKGDCPQAALYCGWYSLGQYIDAFTWVQGAVGYHLASSECTTLRAKHSQVWCKRMLEKGVAATIGPVAEPYIQAFPIPEIFFATLTEGYMSLAESYLVSLPYLSWQMVLIGDPLYRPFASRAQ